MAKQWPDLSGFGASLGGVFNADRTPHGLFLEFASPITVDQRAGLQALSFSRIGVSPERWERPGAKLAFADLKKVFSGFVEAEHLSSSIGPKWIPLQSALGIVVGESVYPSDADLEADGFLGVPAFQLDAEEFNDVAVERMVILGADHVVVSARLRAEVLMACGDDATEAMADAQLAAMVNVAESALAEGSLCVIYRVGDKVFSPPVRFCRDLDAAMSFADHEAVRGYAMDAGLLERPPVEVVEPESSGPASRRGRRAAPEDRIEDYGEKIGGARKDKYGLGKDLDLDRVASMDEKEIAAAVSMTNVWPYSLREAREQGVDPRVAAWIYRLRHSMYSLGECHKKLSYYFDPHLPNEAARFYLEAVGVYRDALEGVKTMEDLVAAIGKFNLKAQAEGWITVTETDQIKRTKMSDFAQRYESILRYRYSRIDFAVDQYDSIVKGMDYACRKACISSAETEDRNRQWDALIAKLAPEKKRASKSFDRPHLSHIQFSGIESGRNGDVSPEVFSQQFGFRGIEFGEWLPQGERQAVLNYAYDGLMALSKAMKLPPRMMSLNGTLAAAFGSRGKGKALAHYEPTRRVFNLTRMNGAGSLAHEFAHALDHWLADQLKACPFGLKTDVLWLSQQTEGIAQKVITQRADADEVRQRLEARLGSGEVFPPHMREALEVAFAMGKVRFSMQNKLTPFDPVVKGADFSTQVETHLSWARNWYGTSDSLRKNLGDGTYAKVYDEVEGLLKSTIAAYSYSKLEMFGGGTIEYEAFDVEKVVQDVHTKLAKFGFSPGKHKKIAAQAERNLNSVARNQAKAMFCELTPEERAEALTKPGQHAYAGLVSDSVVDTAYLSGSKLIDQNRSKPYWATTLEMFARTFECWAFDRIGEAGGRADYLVHGVEEDRYAGAENPYPNGEERKRLNEEMDHLMLSISALYEAFPKMEASSGSQMKLI